MVTIGKRGFARLATFARGGRKAALGRLAAKGRIKARCVDLSVAESPVAPGRQCSMINQ
jgi:hypothetical protein